MKLVLAHSWVPLGPDKQPLTVNELRLAFHAARTARDTDIKPWFQQSWQTIAHALGHVRPEAKATLNAITSAATGLVKKEFWRLDKHAAGGTEGQPGRPARYVILAWGARGDVPKNPGNQSRPSFPNLYDVVPEVLDTQSQGSRDLRKQKENRGKQQREVSDEERRQLVDFIRNRRPGASDALVHHIIHEDGPQLLGELHAEQRRRTHDNELRVNGKRCHRCGNRYLGNHCTHPYCDATEARPAPQAATELAALLVAQNNTDSLSTLPTQAAGGHMSRLHWWDPQAGLPM